MKVVDFIRWKLHFWPWIHLFLEPWKLHLVSVRFVCWAQDICLDRYVLGGGLWHECIFHHRASWWLKICTRGELNWGLSVGRGVFGEMNGIGCRRRAWTLSGRVISHEEAAGPDLTFQCCAFLISDAIWLHRLLQVLSLNVIPLLAA